MKKIWAPALLSVMLFMSSCGAVKGIFKAGFYVGAGAVVIVLILIIYLFIKFRGGSDR